MSRLITLIFSSICIRFNSSAISCKFFLCYMCMVGRISCLVFFLFTNLASVLSITGQIGSLSLCVFCVMQCNAIVGQ